MCPVKTLEVFLSCEVPDFIGIQLYLGKESVKDVCTFLLALQRQLSDYKKRHKKHIPPSSIPKRFLLPPC